LLTCDLPSFSPLLFLSAAVDVCRLIPLSTFSPPLFLPLPTHRTGRKSRQPLSSFSGEADDSSLPLPLHAIGLRPAFHVMPRAPIAPSLRLSLVDNLGEADPPFFPFHVAERRGRGVERSRLFLLSPFHPPLIVSAAFFLFLSSFTGGLPRRFLFPFFSLF